MRGRIDAQAPLFCTFLAEDRIRPDHPLRDVKRRADRILDPYEIYSVHQHGMAPALSASSAVSEAESKPKAGPNP